MLTLASKIIYIADDTMLDAAAIVSAVILGLLIGGLIWYRRHH